MSIEVTNKFEVTDNINNISAEAKKEAEQIISGNLYKYRKLLLFLYILILIFVLIILWTSLLTPLIIGVLVRANPPNETRLHSETLSRSLTNKSQYLPTGCQSNNTNSMQLWNVSRAKEILCPDLYVFDCTKCVPICGLWHGYGYNYYIGYRVLVIVVVVGDLIVSILGIITLACIKGTFSYPQIVYFFMFLNGLIYSVIYCGLAFPGPYFAFCGGRSEEYDIVANNPPIQVNITGVIINYIYLSFNLCFMFATINVFILVFFPTHRFLNRKKSKNILFIISLIVCFGLPILSPVLTFSVSKYYSFIRVPQVPVPNGTGLFLFLIMPLFLIDEIGLTFITISVFKLRLQKLSVTTDVRQTKLKSLELRLIILSFLLWITVFIVLVEASVQIHYAGTVEYYLDDYWSCLTLQLNPFLANQTAEQVVCNPRYRDFVYPIFNYIADFALGMWVILLFVILTTKESRDVWKRVFRCVCAPILKISSTATIQSNSGAGRQPHTNP